MVTKDLERSVESGMEMVSVEADGIFSLQEEQTTGQWVVLSHLSVALCYVTRLMLWLVQRLLYDC